ncbi:hypothetical protein Tco_0040256 [Tanacetum coccineum]
MLHISNDAHKHLMDRHPESLSKAFFTTDKACDAVENGISECFNALIVDARRKPIINMLEDIRVSLMERMQRMREKHVKWNDVGSASGSTPTKEMSASFRTPTRDGSASYRTPTRDGSARVRTPTSVSHVGDSVCGGFVFKTINGKTVRSRGRGDGSKSSAYPHGIRPIGFGVSWDPIDGEPMLGVHQNVQGIPVPAWPYEAEPEEVEPKQAEPEEVEHEQLVIRRRNPVIRRRESERIKQILFKKPPPPGPGLTPDDAMVLE